MAASWFRITLVCLLTTAVFAGQTPPGWGTLEFEFRQIAGAEVYYENCFEPNLPFFEAACRRYLDGPRQEGLDEAGQKRIVEEVNQLLGIEDPNTAQQLKFLSGFGGLERPEIRTFVLVSRSTIKDFLRSGGRPAGFSYDPQSDAAAYRFRWEQTSEGETAEPATLAFPLASPAELERVVPAMFDSIAGFGRDNKMLGVAVHEVAEISLITQIRHVGVYGRWFREGMANAVTYEALRRAVGQAEADEFIAAYAIEPHRDLEKQINLKYWMNASFCVLPVNAPVEREDRLIAARYAYATHEIRQLVERHGIHCIREIVAELGGKERNTEDDILAAIEQVAGEDLPERLQHYQSFATVEEGVPTYTLPFNEAAQSGDSAQMVFCLLRIMELQGDPYSPNNLQSWHNAAVILCKMGHAEAADKAMQDCIELFSHSPIPSGRQAAMESLFLYALKCGRPLSVRVQAEELLAQSPHNVLALTIRMAVQAAEGELAKAQETAKEIQVYAKSSESVPFQLASQILGAKPEGGKTPESVN